MNDDSDHDYSPISRTGAHTPTRRRLLHDDDDDEEEDDGEVDEIHQTELADDDDEEDEDDDDDDEEDDDIGTSPGTTTPGTADTATTTTTTTNNANNSNDNNDRSSRHHRRRHRRRRRRRRGSSGCVLLRATPTLSSVSDPEKSCLVREIGIEGIWSLSTAKPGNGVEQLRDSSVDTYWQSDGTQPHLINVQFTRRVSINEVALYLDYNLDESYTPRKIAIKTGMTFHDLQDVKTVELNEPIGWISIALEGRTNDILDDDAEEDEVEEDEDDDDEDEDGDEDDNDDESSSDEFTTSRTRRRRNRSKKKKRHGKNNNSTNRCNTRRKKPLRTHFIQICILSMHQNGRDTHIRQVKVFGPRSGDELIRRGGRGGAYYATGIGVGGTIGKKGEDGPSSWVCGVPKFQTVQMSQYSTIR